MTAPIGCLDGEQATKHNLPGWSECAMRVQNSDFIAKRVAEGGYGPEADSKLATELHRFIYEYDDADRYRSAWFLHRLELLLEETRRDALSASRQEGWQLVPVEPTPEMIAAAGSTPGMRAIDSASATHQLRGNPLPAAAFADGSPLHQAYRAMLAAAPHQAQEAQGDRHG